ncbi:MAG: hypothetical protein ABI210_01945 [Abditibacteriaceae bacterium]
MEPILDFTQLPHSRGESGNPVEAASCRLFSGEPPEPRNEFSQIRDSSKSTFMCEVVKPV